MCFGGSPSAPTIEYRGPSQADIDRNKAALQTYQSQMQAQQEQFSAQLQEQIDAANQETADLQAKYENQAAAAAASSAAQQTQAYAVTASESEMPEDAQTTAAITKKRKPRNTLKIARNALPAAGGAGLNIGV